MLQWATESVPKRLGDIIGLTEWSARRSTLARRREETTQPWLDGWPEIRDRRVREAFARVPRKEFVAPELEPYALNDAPLPIGAGQTISQPFVVALMSQALQVGPGMRVLEIGAGSGYQTAILCELARVPNQPPGDSVWAVERFEVLAERAAVVLRYLGYAPHLRVGDGAAGWPGADPFDRITVAAAAQAVPRPLWDQLADGGRMVIPVGGSPDDQTLWLLVKQGDSMHSRNLGPVRFVPLISPILDDPHNHVPIIH